jgi:hypothetical protein
MLKGLIFFCLIFVFIFLIWKYFDVINGFLRIGSVFKYIVIGLAICGMIFPRFYSNVDEIGTRIGAFNFLTKYKSNKNFV